MRVRSRKVTLDGIAGGLEGGETQKNTKGHA